MDLTQEKSKSKTKNKKHDLWPVKVFFLTFALAMLFSFFAETTLVGVPIPVAVLVLAVIVLIGIVFDVIGIAVTFQEVTAYTAMASKKIPGAKQAIQLVQESDTVSNICNDVVGDICGIVSGAMGAAISLRLLSVSEGASELIVGIVISGLIAAVTVGGKALGKKYAVNNSHQIVFLVGRLLAVFSGKAKEK